MFRERISFRFGNRHIGNRHSPAFLAFLGCGVQSEMLPLAAQQSPSEPATARRQYRCGSNTLAVDDFPQRRVYVAVHLMRCEDEPALAPSRRIP